jgi:hypothetical protein
MLIEGNILAYRDGLWQDLIKNPYSQMRSSFCTTVIFVTTKKMGVLNHHLNAFVNHISKICALCCFV